MTTNRIRLTKDLDAVSNYPLKHNARETKIIETVLKNKNVDENFDAALLFSSVEKETNVPVGATNAGADAIPVAGDELVFSTRKERFEAHIATIAGTAVWQFPYVSADGLELPVTQSNGITGWEISNGILTTSNAGFTIDTDKTFYCEATIKIDTVTSLTELWFGFRKAAAYQVAPDSYTDRACFNIGEDANGQIEIHTLLNTAGGTTTDTTLTDWAAGGEHTLRVVVDGTGLCSFYFDGALPTVTKADFTFDTTDVVVPFLAITTETGDPGVSISSWRVGYL